MLPTARYRVARMRATGVVLLASSEDGWIAYYPTWVAIAFFGPNRWKRAQHALRQLRTPGWCWNDDTYNLRNSCRAAQDGVVAIGGANFGAPYAPFVMRRKGCAAEAARLARDAVPFSDSAPAAPAKFSYTAKLFHGNSEPDWKPKEGSCLIGEPDIAAEYAEYRSGSGAHLYKIGIDETGLKKAYLEADDDAIWADDDADLDAFRAQARREGFDGDEDIYEYEDTGPDGGMSGTCTKLMTPKAVRQTKVLDKVDLEEMEDLDIDENPGALKLPGVDEWGDFIVEDWADAD